MIYTNCDTNRYLDPLFEAFFGPENKNHVHIGMKTDVLESEDAYRLDIEVPGFKKEDISISYKDGYLNIAVKSAEKKDEAFKLIRQERFYGEASRQYYIGEADEKQIKANYENGVLSVFVPKAKPEEVKPYQIEVH